MKILMVSPSLVASGGSEKAAWLEAELLRSKGHQVVHMAFHDQAARFPEYPVAPNHLNNKARVAAMPWREKGAVVLDVFHNREAVKVLERALRIEKPDLVHLHRTKPLSSALFGVLRGTGVTTIMTLHDHFLTCPTSTRLLAETTPCQLVQCSPTTAIRHRCSGGSLEQTLVSLAEFFVRNHVLSSATAVDAYIVPSLFLQQTVQNANPLLSERLHYIPNFVGSILTGSSGQGRYFAYVGRLSSEKGISTLLDAARLIPQVPIRLIGDGPMRTEIERRIEVDGLSNVAVLGFLSGDAMQRELSDCIATILPSVCFENAPLSILESFASGKPVVGSDRGGISELIVPEETGYLFEPGDSNALAGVLKKMWDEPNRAAEMGIRAQSIVGEKFCAEAHYGLLIQLYKQQVEAKGILT